MSIQTGHVKADAEDEYEGLLENLRLCTGICELRNMGGIVDQKNWVVPVISPYSEDHGGTLTVSRLNFTPDMPSWVSAGQI